MGLRISVDTGGTFTDVVAGGGGREVIGKAPTTPERIFVGMRNALENAAEQLELSLPQLLGETDLLIYGTTRATNAIVQGACAKTAFLVTAGFPDILVLKEGGKHGVHDFATDYPDPYIPQAHTFEVDERIDAEGGVVTPLDREQVRAVLDLVRERGFEAVAVCLLWAVANPAHEEALAGLIEEVLPGVPYTLSHRLIPIVREYRRASATAIDASLKPLMQAHLRDMEDDLRASGCQGEILVSTSVGGCMHVDELVARPIHTVKSGPAMAPVAALAYSQMEGFGDDVIVCDTGGTIVMKGAVAELFDVGRVLVGMAWHQSAKRGQADSFARLWGSHACAIHVRRDMASARDRMPKFCWTADALGGLQVGTYEEPARGVNRGSTVVKVSECVKELVSYPRAGFLWRNAAA